MSHMTTKQLFAIVNESTVVSDEEVQAAIPAFAHQLRYHVAPTWHVGSAAVLFFDSLDSVPPNVWIVSILDDSDEAGALAYHSETPNGRPYAKVFAATCMRYGMSWTSATSHELVEALVDISCNLLADDGNGNFYALEACDPVESTSYYYDGVELSDFVRPGWFDPQAADGTKTRWSQKNSQVLRPFELDNGGYAMIYANGRWSAKYNETYPNWKLAGKQFEGSRTAKRK